MTNEQKIAIQTATKKFVFAQDMVDGINAAVETGKNILLYGPGGHAKSAVAEAVLRCLSKEVYVKAFGIGSKVEDVLGHVNVNALMNQKGSPRIYNHENSFMNNEYAIFEELFDAPPSVIEMFKDVITRGAYCVGGTVCYQSRCKVIIACTNHNPKEWANAPGLTDSQKSSRKALLERFPFHVKVDWPNYGAMEYAAMFKSVFEAKYPQPKQMVVAEIASKSTRNNYFISPRTAIHLLQAYCTSGINSLKYMGIDPDVLQYYIGQEKEIEKDLQILEKLEPVMAGVKRLRTKIEGSTDVLELLQLNLIAEKYEERVRDVRAGQHALKHLGELRTNIRACAHLARERADKNVAVNSTLMNEFLS